MEVVRISEDGMNILAVDLLVVDQTQIIRRNFFKKKHHELQLLHAFTNI